eukprot:857031-Rhodomonas_salina.2
MSSGQLNREEQGFVYKPQWWRTGNKAVETCDPVTLWTLEPSLALPLLDRSLDPPFGLDRPDSSDHRSYFDHTPSGPYRHRPGQHLWTNCSMKTFDDVQLVGAGVVGYLPAFIRFNFRVGGPAT